MTPLSSTATPMPWPERPWAQAAVAPLVTGYWVTTLVASIVAVTESVALTGESTTTRVTPAARPSWPSVDALIDAANALIRERLVTSVARTEASAACAPEP